MTAELEGGRQLSFRVRRARREDIPAVIQVNLASLPENYWPGFFYSILDSWGEFFFVAEVEGRIVGYSMSRVEWVWDPVLLGLHNELEEGKIPLLSKVKSLLTRQYRALHLISIAVLREYRRMGIGSALLRSTIEEARRHSDLVSIYLEVRVSNTPAIRLYEKHGFRRVRIIRGYYRDGEDAYVMVLQLRNPENTPYRETEGEGFL